MCVLKELQCMLHHIREEIEHKVIYNTKIYMLTLPNNVKRITEYLRIFKNVKWFLLKLLKF